MQAWSENGHFKQTERFNPVVYLQNVGQQREFYFNIEQYSKHGNLMFAA